MKKRIGFLLFFLFVGVVACETIHYVITGIKLTPVELYTDISAYDGKEYQAYRRTSEFREEIVFEITCEYEQYSDRAALIETGSRCYAFQPGETTDNKLVEESFSMTLDKDFSFSGKIIPAGTDILRNPDFKREVVITMDRPYVHAPGTDQSCMIEFSKFFVQNSRFDSELYAVTFACRTSDNKELRTVATVKFPSDPK